MPIIPIYLHFQNNSYHTYGLVDSGANRCLFNTNVGTNLGIDVTSVKASHGQSASGHFDIYYHRLIIQIQNLRFRCWVGFSDEYENAAFGLLGHEGIFDNLKRVTFNSRERFVDLIVL
jgi:hypothetical protein